MGLGSMVWGIVSDMFGRKKALIASFTLICVSAVLSSQAPSYPWLLTFQFCMGFGIGGGPQVPVIVTEILPIKYRGGAVIMLAFFWAVGSVFASSLALAIVGSLKWRYYLLIVSSPLLVFLIGSFWIPESPRYLMATGQVTECKRILERIAKANGKTLPKGELCNKEVKRKKSVPILGLFTPDLCRTTITLFLLWFTLTYSYYGIVLLTTSMMQTGIDGCHPHAPTPNTTTNSSGKCQHLTDDDYTELIITTLAEFPGVIVAYLLINNIGRRKSLLMQLSVATLSFILLAICSRKTIMTILMFVSRGLLDGCAQTLYVYSAEVLPTNVRAVGVGIGSMIGRIGAMVTPFAAQVLIHESFYWVILAYTVPLLLCVGATLSLNVETNLKSLDHQSSAGLYESCREPKD